ncbi:MAG: polyphosphate kinase 2 [Planctomycetaceae bacterium]|nr:polyphosphate kinase 2 [Planctomycetaceae bacterium]
MANQTKTAVKAGSTSGNGTVSRNGDKGEGAQFLITADSEVSKTDLVSILAEALESADVMPIPENVLLQDELSDLHSSREFIQLLRSKKVSVGRIKRSIKYEFDLEYLQVELVKMQRWVQETGKRVAILFEGRDAAGKGGTIRRFTEHLNPRAMRVVALPKPTQEETGQWYFQRYIRHLPNPGEIVFFDRSWYNRAVVEPVNGFCSPEQYEQFMRQVPEFEHMLMEDGVQLVKFWFSISKDIQLARFDSRRTNPLKQWKFSPLDQQAQTLWEEYAKYKEFMFGRTHTSFSPWIIVQANKKKFARLESIRYVLSLLDYAGKDESRISLIPDPNIVMRFHRSALGID